MKTGFLAFVLTILFITNSSEFFGQTIIDSTNLYQVETLDGNSYLGNIIVDDGKQIEFNTGKFGIIKFPKDQVKSILKIEKQKVVKGKLWFENPQSTRYFWSPNGYGPVSYTHLRAHETVLDLVCRLLLEKKKKEQKNRKKHTSK